MPAGSTTAELGGGIGAMTASTLVASFLEVSVAAGKPAGTGGVPASPTSAGFKVILMHPFGAVADQHVREVPRTDGRARWRDITTLLWFRGTPSALTRRRSKLAEPLVDIALEPYPQDISRLCRRGDAARAL